MRFASLMLKNVLRRRLRSALTVVGITLAVATTVALVSFAQGLQQSALATYRGHGVDLVVVRAGLTERLTSNLKQSVGQRLAQLPGVAAVNPSLTDMVSFGQSSLVGVPVQGWPIDGFAAKSLHVLRGRRLEPGDKDAVVLGRALAEGLKKDVGDQLEIEATRFKIVGIYEGTNFFDNATAVLPLFTLQRLMDRSNQVTEFQIALQGDVPDVNAATARLRSEIRGFKDDSGKPMGLEAMPTEEYVTSNNEIALAPTRGAQLRDRGAHRLDRHFEHDGDVGHGANPGNRRVARVGWRRSRILRMVLGESLIIGLGGAWRESSSPSSCCAG